MRYILFFLLITVSVSVLGQEKVPKGFIDIKANAENVNRMMSYKNPTTPQLDTLIQLGRFYTQINKDTALLLIEKVISFTVNKQEKDLQQHYARALSSKGAALTAFGEHEEGVKVMSLAKAAFSKVGNQLGVASAERILGMHYMNTGQPKKAVNAFINSLEIYKANSKDSRAFLGPLRGLSDVYFELGDIDKAQLYLSEAILIADTTNFFQQESELRDRQARLYFENGNSYTTRADTFSLQEKAQLSKDTAQIYYQKGLEEAEKGLAAAEAVKDPAYISTSLVTIANLKNQVKDYQGAKLFANRALSLSAQTSYDVAIAESQIHLATALFGLKDFDAAFSAADAAYQLAKKKKYNHLLPGIYDLLIRLYTQKGNADKVLAVLDERNAFEKEQHRSTIQKAIADAEANYQTSEKERQILQQKNDILGLKATKKKMATQRNSLIMGGFLLGLFSFLGYRFHKVKKDRNDKKEFAEALIFAQEEERKRIARDLHDGIGQSLLLIKNQMEKTTEVTTESQKMISDTLDEVRSISRDLHPFQLDKFGLTATINDTILKIEQSTDLFITREIEDIDHLLDAKSEIHLFRIIQEALSNIVKHAGATAAKINIASTSDKIKVTIQDNGKGFDLEMAVVTSKSLGIRTMHERVSAIGGQLKIQKGTNGNGTLVEVTIPKTKK